MVRFKKIIAAGLVCIFSLLSLIGCGTGTSSENLKGNNSEKKVVKIGITTPDDLIWNAVKKKAAEDNIEVQTVCFSNVNINQVLADGDVDLNAFQHYAYFDKNTKDLGLNLVSLGDMYILRLDIYSKKYKNLNELPDGAKIAVPNDAVNIGRSLKVFEEAGLIKLKEGSGDSPEFADVTKNAHKDTKATSDKINPSGYCPSTTKSPTSGVATASWSFSIAIRPFSPRLIPRLPNTAPQIQEAIVGTSTTPSTNSRIVRPLEIRATNTPTNGAHAMNHAQ